ncbi:MAG: aminotransferase class IV [Sphingomonadaceae bacterium]
MSAVAYVNGRFLPITEAGIGIEDRSVQFADSIYEVVAFFSHRLLDMDRHIWRLRRNAAALFLDGVPTDVVLARLANRLIARSRLNDGLLYIQVSRGVAKRDHGFPTNTATGLMMTARRFDFRQRLTQQHEGVCAISLPDQRWSRCDIKTTGLLPAVLAKEEARRAGAFEAILYQPDGVVTEGASTNIWMVDGEGRLVTHPLCASILPGIARETLMAIAREQGIPVLERTFTLAEARAAPELFLTSTTAPVLPIVRLDGAPVGAGRPGPVVARLVPLVWKNIESLTGWRAEK